MKLNPQFIYKNKKREWAILPINEFTDVLERLEDLQDHIEIQERIAEGGETFPGELIFTICEGKNPIKAYREYRSLSQVELAEAVKVSKQYISQLETGERDGSIKVLKAIAQALKVDLDDLVEK